MAQFIKRYAYVLIYVTTDEYREIGKQELEKRRNGRR